MSKKRIFPVIIYLRKIANSFFPRFFFKLYPKRFWAQQHWRNQNKGDIHGFDNYCFDRPTVNVVLPEIQRLATKDQTILDLGCNCGYYLHRLKNEGYSHLTGIDICGNAIEYGKAHFNLSDVEMITGSFDDVLPRLCADKRKFNLVYTVGATIELVHPSFDVVKYICAISDQYIVLIISQWGHAYPRFWEYEFNRNGFFLVKCITPDDGNLKLRDDPTQMSSLMVFTKML